MRTVGIVMLIIGSGLMLLAVSYLVFQGIPDAPPEMGQETMNIGYSIGMCGCPLGILVVGGTLLLVSGDRRD